MMHATLAGLKNKRRIKLCLFACLLTMQSSLYATEPMVENADNVKATAVAKTVASILRYAHWPEYNDHNQLCVTGQSHYSSTLLQQNFLAANWKANTLLLESADARLSRDCQALYIGKLSALEESQLFARIQQLPILTISENNPSCTVGSMFCLYITAGKTRFKVNLDSVARSGVRIHPNVLLLGKPKESEL